MFLPWEYSVRNRTRRLRTMRLVILKSTLLCLCGGVIGSLLANLILWSGGFVIGAEGATIAFRPSIELMASGTAVAAVVGVLAGLAPAVQVATAPIVASLRAE